MKFGTVIVLDNTKCLRKAYMTPRLIALLELFNVKVDTLSTPHGVQEFIKNPPSDLIGIILSGGPLCLSDHIGIEFYASNVQLMLHFTNIPVLGICFGFQVMGYIYGGVIDKIPLYHYTTKCVTGIYKGCTIHAGLQTSTKMGGLKLIHPQKSILCDNNYPILAYANHCDQLIRPPPNFKTTIYGPKGCIEGIEMIRCEGGCRVGVQFHPEGSETTHFMIKNFMLHCIRWRHFI